MSGVIAPSPSPRVREAGLSPRVREAGLSPGSVRAQGMAEGCQWIAGALGEPSSPLSVSVARFASYFGEGGERALILTGVGKSQGVGRVLVAMFQSIGLRSWFLHPAEALHGDLGMVRPGDVVLAISHRGASPELLSLAPRLLERDCPLFAMTAASQSPLAQLSSWLLLLPPQSEGCPLGYAPITSAVTSLALGQILVAAVMDHTGLDLETYASHHPGGSIGRSISLRVLDILVREPQPVVPWTAGFQEILSVMTASRYGAVVCLGEDGRLLGLVTERDVRKAMEVHGPAAFNLCFADIGNRAPVTVPSSLLASRALGVMEDSERPLSVLPVLNEEGSFVSLLHLHDLVRCGFSLGR